MTRSRDELIKHYTRATKSTKEVFEELPDTEVMVLRL
jgi:hypothetical protein